MQGPQFPAALAKLRDQALVAINGAVSLPAGSGEMPLGAPQRKQGRWLSGPILKRRGAVRWRPRELPQFGRLRLEEWLTDENRQALAADHSEQWVCPAAAWPVLQRPTGGAGIAPRAAPRRLV